MQPSLTGARPRHHIGAGMRLSLVLARVGVAAAVLAGAGCVDLETGTSEGDRHPTWSPDGKLIAFQRDVEDEANQIYVVDENGHNLKKLTTEDTLYTVNTEPAWSPNGKRIAFSRNGELYVMDADGSDQHALRQGCYERDPAWSPDGKLIAFVSDGCGAFFGIYVMRADGRSARRFTVGPHAEDNPAWSPNGQWIAYDIPTTSSSCCAGVYVIRRDGKGPRLLAKVGEKPAWSPDGTTIAFTRFRNFSTSLYVIRADGSGLRRVPITIEGVSNSPVAWSPDAHKLAIELGGRLYVMNVDGSDLRPLTDGG